MAEIHRQRVEFGVASNSIELEFIRISSIKLFNPSQNIVTVIINCRNRRTSVLRHKHSKRSRRIGHSFIRIDVVFREMIDSDQLELVCVECFFQFISNSQLITPVSFFQLVASNANVLNRIRLVMTTWFLEVTHFATTHEVSDEFETLAVPGIEKRTR